MTSVTLLVGERKLLTSHPKGHVQYEHSETDSLGNDGHALFCP